MFIVDEDALSQYAGIVYNNCSSVVPEEDLNGTDFHAMHYSITNAYSKTVSCFSDNIVFLAPNIRQGKHYQDRLQSAFAVASKSNQRMPHPNEELMYDLFMSDILASALSPVFSLLADRVRTIYVRRLLLICL